MKTVDEAIRNYVDENIPNISYDSTFREGIKFAQKWINVEDELPSNTKNVLVKNDKEWVSIGYYMEGYKIWEDIAPVGQKEFGNVAYWRPIEIRV